MRRLALPLALSLAGHGLVVGLAWLLPLPLAPQRQGAAAAAGCARAVGGVSPPPRPTPTPAAAPPVPAPAQRAPAERDQVARATIRLEDVVPSGGTDHVAALRRGLLLRPDVRFLLTDADDLRDADVAAVTRITAGRTAIHVVE